MARRSSGGRGRTFGQREQYLHERACSRGREDGWGGVGGVVGVVGVGVVCDWQQHRGQKGGWEQLILGFVGQAEFCTLFCEQRGSKWVRPIGKPSQGMKWRELWLRSVQWEQETIPGTCHRNHRANVVEY